jgi:ABC-type lipoprotein export system ATPase subunit
MTNQEPYPSDEPVVLVLRNIVKHYDSPGSGERVQVLRGLSLIVASGDSIAIMGPSGSGKSTLLNIMGALDLPSSGTVSLEGRELTGCNDRELAVIRNREIGFVFQLHHLLPQCTVLENVLVPTLPRYEPSDKRDAEKRAVELLESVGLASHLDHRPAQLSGGERQRAAVVRALINRPRLLLADEPTGSLDQESAELLVRLLVDLNEKQGVTLITVTHDPSIAAFMKRRLKLVRGTLLE